MASEATTATTVVVPDQTTTIEGSVDSMIGRLSAAYEENGGRSLQTNLFASRSVSMYLRKVKDGQAKARGFYEVLA
ncbi:hypothetical protein IFM89_008427 [Coptis chinensis]|uniref:ALOG domain-containing protein n=1 Tax=Coptis chinensis TaxID=261450 RepID=A0A835LDW9_9MAGN|nr:hypothetical protein IFM89_008427 [Coptis chinensis]